MTMICKQRGLILAGVMLCAAAVVAGEPLRIATLFPESSRVMKELKSAALSVEEQTDGRVRFKFFTGGVMGEDSAALQKIAADELDGAIVNGGALIPHCPDALLYHLPLKFRDAREVELARREFDPRLIDGLSSAGLTTLGIADSGFARILSREPVRTPAELAEQELWTPGSELILELAQAMQLKPVVLPMNEVREGLGDGRINAVIAAPMGALAQQWHTRVKYLTDLPLFYMDMVFIVSGADFAALDAADQRIVREQFGRGIAAVSALNREFNARSLEVMQKRGVERVVPTDAELRLWREWSAGAAQRLVERELLRREELQRLERLLARARGEAL